MIRLVARAEPHIYLWETPMPTMSQRYNEHPAKALTSVVPHLDRVGASLSGIVANDAHRYGYHLSAVRLGATGKRTDYSLKGQANIPVADDRAACAIDIGMDWPASRAWLEWVRTQRRAGRLMQITELIGSVDGRKAMYAAPSTDWVWDHYDGDGHVAWCHVGIGRRHANDTSFGEQLLAGWTADGREDDDVNKAQDERLINVERMFGALRDRKDTVDLVDNGKKVTLQMGLVKDLKALDARLARIEAALTAKQ